MADRVFDDSMSTGPRPSGSRIYNDSRGWTNGAVMTPHGFVVVYAQGDEKHTDHSRLDFIWKGRLHMRNFNDQRLTPRGLTTAAARFVAEIVESNP